jgi:5-formyltetrahydrofolate cyclo-ligase
MRSDELKRAKRRLRREVLSRRDALDEGIRVRAGDAITQGVLSLPEVVAATHVMAFWSFGSEVPTSSLLTALSDRGVRVALPRIEDGDLEVRAWSPGDPMTETSFGALEPAEGARVDPGALDVVVVPAVAFDRHGRRVGYGAGFYDRFLPRLRPEAARIGIAYAVQMLDRDLPSGAFDQPVDAVVTEVGVVRVPR